MRRVLVAAAFAAAALLAPGAQGASARSFQLRVGDAVVVSGTTVVCFPFDASLGAIACALWRRATPVPGTYSARLAADGAVTLTRVSAHGLGPVVLRRRMQARETIYRAVAGDDFGWQIAGGLRLDCRVRSGGPVTVECFRTGGTLPVAGYGLRISERAAAAVRFDAGGRAASTATRRPPGR